MRKLPNGLKIGVATASYQIEGGWNAGDKTPSIWDTHCHKEPCPVKDNTSGDDTCESFKYYKRDLEMIKFLGFHFYRFSISWPRLLPDGFTNRISETGREYYNNLINGLLENNIEPIITLYHWDLPQTLQELGGWSNPLIVDWFGDYAAVAYQLFGDRVKTWITINEPKQIGVFGYGMTRMAPALNISGIADYIAAKNMVLAHARAWHIYDKQFRSTQKGTCGITIATDFRVGLSDSRDDVEAGLDAMDFEVGLYSHPIFTSKGGFPERVIQRVAEKSKEQGYTRSRLPDFSDEEIEYAKGTSDFYGFNHYSTKFFTRDTYTPGKHPIPSYDDDIGADFTYLDYEKGAVPHVTVIPHGIRKALKWVKENCNNPPIMITENGFATFGGLEDMDRIFYFRKYLYSILDAIEIDGCNVTSYTVWSLMDNFEWDSGLSVKFGLFEVDFEDEKKTRTARLSALWFKRLIKTKCLDLEHIPEMEEKIHF
ncbi:seminal fluid protein CSSFP001 [Danaus plexippus plexippus]|uniref:Seminal fluid protein CSSFP001 n=1 Tax=Danaus plexippus plexippus TaxID=278856 RepID=A0A212F963_DANPL|nr:seminal fluid protein CSSFP001 [Danaus plexippus plexippus]